MNMILVYF